jgi:hypothetical protein
MQFLPRCLSEISFCDMDKHCLNRLGYDIEIKVRPAAEPLGHLMLAPARSALAVVAVSQVRVMSVQRRR